jgi:hypothetical protein
MLYGSMALVLQWSKLFASCDQIENSPRRRGGLRERDFEIKNLCELCVLCGESLISDWVAALPRCDICDFRHELPKPDPVFWLMMQIAIAGFLTSYPVDCWLNHKGIKEKR